MNPRSDARVRDRPPPAAGIPAPRGLSVALHASRLAYGEHVVFEALEARLEGGLVTALLGPSGAGKTTLLKRLAGLIAPAPGDRVECGDGAPLAGRVAYMGQTDLLLPWLDALDNVCLGARLRSERPDHEAARAILAGLGLGDHAGSRVDRLSGGMRQRVALARTLMEARPVVLMDEPFSALDAVTRHRLQALFVERLAGRTVLLVTHDPTEAVRVAHRIHVLRGQPARLDEPLSPPGEPARDPTDPRLRDTLATLMRRLGMTGDG